MILIHFYVFVDLYFLYKYARICIFIHFSFALCAILLLIYNLYYKRALSRALSCALTRGREIFLIKVALLLKKSDIAALPQ